MFHSNPVIDFIYLFISNILSILNMI